MHEAQTTIHVLHGSDSTDFMQYAFNLMTGGFFSTSADAQEAGDTAAPNIQIVVNSHETASVDAHGLGPSSLKIMDDDGVPEAQGRMADDAHSSQSQTEESDEYHQVRSKPPPNAHTRKFLAISPRALAAHFLCLPLVTSAPPPRPLPPRPPGIRAGVSRGTRR